MAKAVKKAENRAALTFKEKPLLPASERVQGGSSLAAAQEVTLHTINLLYGLTSPHIFLVGTCGVHLKYWGSKCSNIYISHEEENREFMSF